MTGKKILLVDYDPKSLTYTRTLLQGAGFEVSTCGDGLSAIDQFKSEAPDMVLLSAMLPKMHGFEVCSNIRKLPGGEKTPVVIITDVYKGKRYRIDAIQKYGATEYIEKPIEDANLVSIIKGLMNGAPAVTMIEPAADELEEKTVQFNRDALMNKLGAENAPAVTPRPPEKKATEKHRAKDDMEKKLEQSLAGLDLGMTKSRPKPKPAAEAKAPEKPAAPPAGEPSPPAGDLPKESTAEQAFTSEDLFTDVIASVERELQSEKLITKSGVEEVSHTQPTAVAQSAPPASTPQKPAEHQKKSAPASAFDSALEKKLSDTLSGLMKDKPAPAKTVSMPTPAKPEPPKAEPPKPAPKPAETAAPPEAVKPVETPKPAPPPTPAPLPTPPQEPLPVAPTLMMGREKLVDAGAPMPEEGINFGQYLLLSKIATGGMAELFKAKRKGVEGFEKILAIKKILPHMSDNEEFITMFIDEAKLAAQLSHHNVCQIFDLGKIENSYYIAMEYVHGKDLRAVLKAARQKNKTVPVEIAVLITSKICSALDYAHRKRDANGQPLNLVHRDVSPQNILISYEGDVKLVDFGIAKAATKVHVTQHGALKGKLLYMSPEQAWGRSVDRRSDIFSVGVVLYEMLTGRPLFFDDNDTEVTILEKVREARIVPLRELNSKFSAELERIILKALKKNPEDRYQTASEMQKDLDNLFYTEGYNATSASLANFARSLFPEEWGQESGSKDTVMIDREVSDAIKAALPKAAPRTETPAPVRPAPKPEPPAPPKPAPQASQPHHAPAPAPARPAAAAPEPQHKPRPEPEKKAPEPPTTSPSASGFRDISMPEIIPDQTEKSHTMMIVLGIAALALVVGAIAYFLFRSKPAQEAAVSPAPAQQQQQQSAQQPSTPPDSATTNPVVAPPAATPAAQDPAALEKAKQELQKKIEEEQKKVDQLKQDEAARKAEDDRNKAEQAKLQEQQKADQQKPPEAKPEPVAQTPPTQEAQPQEAQVQPPPPVVQEQPKPEPPAQEAAPAEPEVHEGDLVEATPDVIKPSVVTRVEPAYPPIARSKKVEGTVILSVLVTESGAVSDVKVLREAGGSMGLNEAAVAAVKKWKFRPAVKAGKRVKVWVTYPVVFKVQ